MQLTTAAETPIYTLGHSNHPLERFLVLLMEHKIGALADVRSHPYSKSNPQFNRDELERELRSRGITYVFLGKELGGRTSDQSCYLGGKVQYDALARTELFREGLTRVQRGMTKFRVALMCAEADPLFCHRAVLISRYLQESGVRVRHILKSGLIEYHDLSMERLLGILKLRENLLLRNKADLILEAYRIRAEQIAYEVRDGEVPRRHLSATANGR
jgi:uncharacterized protein (DUF488 family)